MEGSTNPTPDLSLDEFCQVLAETLEAELAAKRLRGEKLSVMREGQEVILQPSDQRYYPGT